MINDIHKLLDPFHKEDLDNLTHPAIYIEHNDYHLLILRFPIQDEQQNVSLVSQGIVIKNNDIFLYNKVQQQLIKLDRGWQSLYEILDHNIDETLTLVNSFREDIIDMEESLYTQQITQKFLNNWFTIKKELIRLNRVIERTTQTYEKFYQKNEKNIQPFIHNFNDLLEHLTRSQRYMEHDIEKLNTIYNFYSARSNDTINQSIYILTILSAIFLPLNLIVGFFGMNTGTLPFTQAGGTQNVIFILGSIFITLFLFFLIKRNKRSL